MDKLSKLKLLNQFKMFICDLLIFQVAGHKECHEGILIFQWGLEE